MSNDDDDERSVAPVPLLPPPAPPVDGGLGIGPAVDAQRLPPPAAGAQRLPPPTAHDAQRLQHPGAHHDAQRLGQDSVDAQRAQPHVDAQRTDIVDHATDVKPHPVDTQRAASDVQKARHTGRARSLRRLRPRTKFMMAAGAAIVAAGSTVLIVNAQDDDTPRTAPATTLVITAPTTVPRTTQAAPTTDAASVPSATAEPSTSAATTTVVETTVIESTAVPVAESVAGVYTVAVSASHLVSSATGTINLPQQAADVWNLEGPCDGVGSCTMSLASAALAGGSAPTAGAITSVELSPSGPGTYSGTQDLTEAVAAEGASCGTATAEFNVTFADGGLSGTYLATFSGGADCPPFTISSTYAGMLNS